MNETPLESKEQSRFVVWAREQGIKLSSLNQSTHTDSWKQLAKLRSSGTERGIPDLILVIPPERRENNRWKLLFIEMKRVKGSNTSKEQKEWISIINESGVDAKVCKGCDEAIEYTKQFFTKELPPIPQGKELDKLIHNL